MLFLCVRFSKLIEREKEKRKEAYHPDWYLD